MMAEIHAQYFPVVLPKILNVAGKIRKLDQKTVKITKSATSLALVRPLLRVI